MFDQAWPTGCRGFAGPGPPPLWMNIKALAPEGLPPDAYSTRLDSRLDFCQSRERRCNTCVILRVG